MRTSLASGGFDNDRSKCKRDQVFNGNGWFFFFFLLFFLLFFLSDGFFYFFFFFYIKKRIKPIPSNWQEAGSKNGNWGIGGMSHYPGDISRLKDAGNYNLLMEDEHCNITNRWSRQGQLKNIPGWTLQIKGCNGALDSHVNTLNGNEGAMPGIGLERDPIKNSKG